MFAAAAVAMVSLTSFGTDGAAQAPQPTAEQRRRGVEIQEALLQALDPDLLQRAAEKQIYDRAAYPVLRTVNPFFLRGDFDGDGSLDLAVWVRQQSSRLQGVAVIHSTMDRARYLGAGHTEYGTIEKRAEVLADTWRIIPPGTTVRAFASVSEIGARAGQPFTVRRETLEFHWLGKSAFAYYWEKGRYWLIETGD